MVRCGFRHPPAPRGPPPPRSGTGCCGRRRAARSAVRRVGLGGPQAAGCTGLRQRPAVGEQRVQRRTDTADVVGGGGVGHGRREREGHVAVDADADAAGMVDGQRHPAACAASAAAASACTARAPPIGDGEVSATSFSDPPRIHSETTRPPAPALVTSSTRATPGLSSRLSLRVRSRISCTCPGGSVPPGSTKVNATWRSRAVSRACQNRSAVGPPWDTSSR